MFPLSADELNFEYITSILGMDSFNYLFLEDKDGNYWLAQDQLTADAFLKETDEPEDNNFGYIYGFWIDYLASVNRGNRWNAIGSKDLKEELEVLLTGYSMTDVYEKYISVCPETANLTLVNAKVKGNYNFSCAYFSKNLGINSLICCILPYYITCRYEV